MQRLSVLRHAKSIGNIKRIIQGREDYGLSEEGRYLFSEWLEEEGDSLRDVDVVWCSVMSRARETLTLILESTGVSPDIYVSEKLVEFDPGLLSNLSHNCAKSLFPEYHEVWMRRGDLDEIPFAELGDQLQGRVINFLFRLQRQSEVNHLIIAHAGYIRCLVNTIMNIRRDTPVNVEHNFLHQLEFDGLDYDEISGGITIVCEVHAFDKDYIVKVVPYNKSKHDLYSHLKDNALGFTPNVLDVWYYEESLSIVKTKYLGTHLFGIVDQNAEHAFARTMIELTTRLQTDQGLFDILRENCRTLPNLFSGLMQSSYTGKLNDMKNKLISYEIPEWLEIQPCSDVVFYDSHRYNLLFIDDKLSIIDIEGLAVAMREYQVASIIVTFYLLEGYPFKSMKDILTLYCSSVDEDTLARLILIRLFYGAVKTSRENKHQGIHKKYIALFNDGLNYFSDHLQLVIV